MPNFMYSESHPTPSHSPSLQPYITQSLKIITQSLQIITQSLHTITKSQHSITESLHSKTQSLYSITQLIHSLALSLHRLTQSLHNIHEVIANIQRTRKFWAYFSSLNKEKGEGLCRENTSIFFKSLYSHLSKIYFVLQKKKFCTLHWYMVNVWIFHLLSSLIK